MARRRGTGYERVEVLDKRFQEKMELLGEAGVVNPRVAKMAIEGYERAAGDLKTALSKIKEMARALGIRNEDIPKYVQVCMWAWKEARKGRQPAEYMPVVEALARMKGIDMRRCERILVDLGVPTRGRVQIIPRGGGGVGGGPAEAIFG